MTDTLALACVAAARAARNTREAQTVCRTATVFDQQFPVYSSHLYAVLRENGETAHLVPLATFLPNGKMELYPDGAALPFFQSRIDSDV
ncbi:MAG: hypothetical protein ACRDQZ_13250 [Mycobacteriales bacterium]